MKNIFLFLLFLFFKPIFAQPNSADDILSHTVADHTIPENLLSVRSVAFYDSLYTPAELKEIQNAFQKTGIDTEVYFPVEKSFIGMDFCRPLSNYFVSRKIQYLVFLQKNSSLYKITIAPFCGNPAFVKEGQRVLSLSNISLKPILIQLFQEGLASQKKRNHLINDFPEEPRLKYFSGQRNESFTHSVLTQRIAIPQMGDEAMNTALKKCFDTTNFKYKIVDPNLTDGQLREQGFVAVLRYVHTQGKLAWELLGYDKDKMASGIPGLPYSDENSQITTQPSEVVVYKFYFKHLDFGDLFLGNTWDAAPQWEYALSNHLHALAKGTTATITKSP